MRTLAFILTKTIIVPRAKAGARGMTSNGMYTKRPKYLLVMFRNFYLTSTFHGIVGVSTLGTVSVTSAKPQETTSTHLNSKPLRHAQHHEAGRHQRYVISDRTTSGRRRFTCSGLDKVWLDHRNGGYRPRVTITKSAGSRSAKEHSSAELCYLICTVQLALC